MTATADDVVGAARALLGTAFHHQARLPGVGLDCAGVVVVVGRQLGLFDPAFDVTDYPRVPDGSTLQAYCDQYLAPAADPATGGVVLVAWGRGEPQHMGIVVPYVHGGLAMVHAESRRHKRVIETRLLFGRAMRLVRAYRFPGVA